jgi:phosphatidylserine/phosphatidylglycerophosphate/cardiolipin synthase-like enzyme
LVQAYSFTSPPIAQALVRAKERGVIVKVTLDKGQERDKHSQMGYVAKAGIPVLIDRPPGLAHNKVMIIDDAIVVTGSFNFTRAAQMRNVENLLFIQSKSLAATYTKQWQDRAIVSSVATTKP